MELTAYDAAVTNQLAQQLVNQINTQFPALQQDGSITLDDAIALLNWLKQNANNPPDTRITTAINTAATAFYNSMNTGNASLLTTLQNEFTEL